MHLGKAFVYGLVCYCCFFAGQKLNTDGRAGPYQLIEQQDKWYLETPNGTHLISERHQLGSIQYRMQGLLDEKVEDLKNSFRKITLREAQ